MNIRKESGDRVHRTGSEKVQLLFHAFSLGTKSLSPGNPVLSFISTAERLEQVASETRPLNKWRFPFTCSSQLKSISGFSRCQHSFVYVGCVNGCKVNAAVSIQAACEVPVFNRLCP